MKETPKAFVDRADYWKAFHDQDYWQTIGRPSNLKVLSPAWFATFHKDKDSPPLWDLPAAHYFLHTNTNPDRALPWMGGRFKLADNSPWIESFEISALHKFVQAAEGAKAGDKTAAYEEAGKNAVVFAKNRAVAFSKDWREDRMLGRIGAELFMIEEMVAEGDETRGGLLSSGDPRKDARGREFLKFGKQRDYFERWIHNTCFAPFSVLVKDGKDPSDFRPDASPVRNMDQGGSAGPPVSVGGKIWRA